MSFITRRRALALGTGAFVLPQAVRAQAWPSGPVTFVVGYAAGGLRDAVGGCLLATGTAGRCSASTLAVRPATASERAFEVVCNEIST